MGWGRGCRGVEALAMTTTALHRSFTAVSRAAAASIVGVTVLVPLGSALGQWLAR